MKSTLLCAFCWFSLAISQNVENDPCTLSKLQSPGVCILIENCAEAIENLRNGQFPQTCGFSGVKPLVCCSENNSEYSKPKPQSNITISQKKCKEYASFAFESAPFPINQQPIKVDRCEDKFGPLIVGGTAAGLREFPNMAFIGISIKFYNLSEWICVGSLISEQHILTTATCLRHKHGVATVAALGITQISESANRQEYKIVERIPHPEYHETSKSNDIAILKLETPVKINKFVRPACLHADVNVSNSRLLAVGWANTRYYDDVDLVKQTSQFLNHTFCPNRTILEEGQVCVNATFEQDWHCLKLEEPIVHLSHDWNDGHCMYDIVGVNSDTEDCSGSPLLYTKVSHYVKWIERIVWPSSNQ